MSTTKQLIALGILLCTLVPVFGIDKTTVFVACVLYVGAGWLWSKFKARRSA